MYLETSKYFYDSIWAKLITFCRRLIFEVKDLQSSKMSNVLLVSNTFANMYAAPSPKELLSIVAFKAKMNIT
jgi:hypothetical protein